MINKFNNLLDDAPTTPRKVLYVEYVSTLENLGGSLGLYTQNNGSYPDYIDMSEEAYTSYGTLLNHSPDTFSGIPIRRKVY